jgi:hypothetical protein
VPDRVAIVQSNYLPWKGYFDLIAGVDAFVLYDEVQYTKRDWRNRNRIKTASGLRWLTVPVEVKGRYHQRIDEVAVADPDWARSHLGAIEQAYADAPHLSAYRDVLRDGLTEAARHNRLSDVNRSLIELMCAQLDIDTPLLWSTDVDRQPLEGVEPRTARLLGLCLALGATEYVSGPAARAYVDVDAFSAHGVRVLWADYSGYPEYPQPHPPFEHGVSVVDLLLCAGPDARSYMRAEEVVHAG